MANTISLARDCGERARLRNAMCALICLVLGLAGIREVGAQNASIPAPEEQPGPGYLRQPDGSYGAESIDPFTGALKIVAADLIVPSNGGLDIAITRTYTSMQKTNSTMPSYLPGRTTTGIGWDIHFGRVWRSGATSGYTLPATNCLGVAGSADWTDARHNPVLELPDGSREVLVTADSGKPYSFITRSRWIGQCLGTANDLGQGGLRIISPEGIKYNFNVRGRVASGVINNNAETAYAYHVSKIEHPDGTSLTISYDGVASDEFLRIDTITHSEGQTVSFTYLEPTTVNARLHEIKLNSPSRTWTYDYEVALTGGGVSFHYLSEVTRPDGESFTYDYYTGSSDIGRYSLKSVTTPLGAKVTYTYKNQLFPRHSTPAVPVIVVGTKVINGQVDASATWAYSYDPASSSELFDTTEVDGPSNCVTYRHRAATTANGELWRVGLLEERSIGSSCSSGIKRRESYNWTSQVLAQQNYWSPPDVFDSETNAPLLQSLAIELDGTSYTTTYSNYDEYGNARHVVESGQDSRVTDRTFHIDTTRWIVNRLKDESIESADGTSDYNVDREYYANGTLQSEARAGVETSYTWYSSGTSRGEIETITDPEGNVVTFSNYKRGTAQNESHPEAVTISRTVNGTGAVDSQTDPLARQTVFGYDNLNVLTSVQTPKPTDDNITISLADSKRRRTLTRGTYVEERTYDGMGRLRQTKMTDTQTARVIVKKFEIDAEGRTVRSYAPASTTASALYERYEYDELGRLEQITRTDGATVSFQYSSNNRVQVTNERGFATTYAYRSYGDPAVKELMSIQARAGDTPSENKFVTTSIERNRLGQVTSVTQGGLTRGYHYDSRFFLVYEDDPELGTISYGRDAVGNMVSRKVGSSGTTSYALDNLYRTDYVTYPANGSQPAFTVDYDYYKNGLLKQTIRGSLTWDYTYDANNNLELERATMGGTQYGITYGYDTRDSLSTVTYPSGLQVSYVPNAFGQATRVTSGLGTHVSAVAYFPNGQIDTLTYANGYTTDYGQNSRLLPTALQTSATRNGASVNLIDMMYAYDFASNTTHIYDYRDTSKHRSMAYDGVNRLRTAAGPYGSGGVAATGTFTYDGRNNILTKTFPEQSFTYNYNTTSGRLDTITQGGSTMTFAYDVYGNVTANGRNQLGFGMFSYDSASNLAVVGSPARIQYSYDGKGRIAVDSRADGTSTRYSLYTQAERRLYDIDIVNKEATDYIYLGHMLVASRSHCTDVSDADGDGIPTCVEWRSGMNPQNAADAAMDTDGDGLSDLQEYQASTNIFNADTDSDGLSDGYERRYGLNALSADSNTTDTDGDTLTNLQEFQLGTRPDRVDTDGDGIADNVDPKPRFNPAILPPILQLILE